MHADYAIATSMDGPIQSATLIKNEQKALPLDGATAGKIAVIGPTAGLSQGDAGYCEQPATSSNHLLVILLVKARFSGVDKHNSRSKLLLVC